jgi:membrane fusion protein, multidrug efflux system
MQGNRLLPLAMLTVTTLCGNAAAQQTARQVEVAPVTIDRAERKIELPGEFRPYQSVALRARVSGYVEKVLVDVGSMVRKGQLLIVVAAPETAAQIAEAQSRVQLTMADETQAAAQLAAAQSTYERLKKAAETPGTIAGNELVQAEKQVEAAQASVNSRRSSTHASEAALRALKEMEAYLQIAAPFDGVITERLAHPGALVKADSEPALLVLQQVSRLRLVVPVPEENVGGIVRGAHVSFRVPAFPQRTYTGMIARISHSLDEKTRTENVELDVINRDGTLSPGMYPTVSWPVQWQRPALLVPETSVVTTTERVFVIRVRNGRAEWVDVRKGPSAGDHVEVTGALQAGDLVVRRATDEIRDGALLRPTGQ